MPDRSSAEILESVADLLTREERLWLEKIIPNESDSVSDTFDVFLSEIPFLEPEERHEWCKELLFFAYGDVAAPEIMESIQRYIRVTDEIDGKATLEKEEPPTPSPEKKIT